MTLLTPPTRRQSAAFICNRCSFHVRPRYRPNIPHTLDAKCSTVSTSSSSPRKRPSTVQRRQHSPLTISSPLHAAPVIKSEPRLSKFDAFQAQSIPARRYFAYLQNRELIHLWGDDAPKFLQGLITNNVDLTRISPFYAAFLDARGRVLWDVFVWPKIDGGKWGCYIEIDKDEKAALLKHLKRHRLRSKVQLRSIASDELHVLATWDESASTVDQSMQRYLQGWNNVEGIEYTCSDPRLNDFGARVLRRGSASQSSGAATNLLGEEVNIEGYRKRRYLFGIPEGPHELQRETALPMEGNIDLMQGIDFRKGCYVGQELTIRTKHTGVVRKRILPVRLYTSNESPRGETQPLSSSNTDSVSLAPNLVDSIPYGKDIKQLSDGRMRVKSRPAGKIIGASGNIGLALCRLEMMTPLRVSAEGGSWQEGTEFGMNIDEDDGTGKLVKVKAFVPPWLEQREAHLWGKGRSKAAIEQNTSA